MYGDSNRRNPCAVSAVNTIIQHLNLNNFYITKTGTGNNPLPVLFFETYYLMVKEENLNPCFKIK